MTGRSPRHQENHPAYGGLRASLRQLLAPAMDPVRAADFAQAVKAYANGVDAKPDVFSMGSGF